MKRFLVVILLTALLPDVSIWSLYLREVPLLVSILWFLPTTPADRSLAGPGV